MLTICPWHRRRSSPTISSRRSSSGSRPTNHRASWSRAVSRPGFRRRLHELHGAPPVLGVLHNWDNEGIPRFIHTTASPFSLAAPDHRSWRALDCRHGRALFLSTGRVTKELLIWEPITGAQQRVPLPAAFTSDCSNAAVFCGADGCDHRDCLGGPFRVAFVFVVILEEDTVDDDDDEEECITLASVYSSETGTWGEPTMMHGWLGLGDPAFISSVLVGRSLFYFLSDAGFIIEYDMDRHALAVFHTPADSRARYEERFNLMLTDDGGLGVGVSESLAHPKFGGSGIEVSESLYPQLKLWSWEAASDGTDARWVLSRVIYLDKLLPNGALMNPEASVLHVLGFAEGANVIFVTTADGLFTIDLQSELVRKVCDDHGFCNLIPVVSFYTPVPRGEHHGLPPSNLCEDRAGEEQKVAEHVQQLFDKGSNAFEEGGFVNVGISHPVDLETRACYGEVAPACASTFDKYGHALLYKSREVNDAPGDVPNSAPNEELVKGTTSKDGAGNSTTSGSNVDGAAPPLEKGDFGDGGVFWSMCGF